MAHVPFRAEIQEVSQGNAIRWNAAEEFYNNQGSNITLQHMSARHIIVFPSANITVTLPDTNTLLDGWQVHVGFPFSTSDNPFEITVKDAAGAEWRKLIKGQWCECVKKGGSWYVYPPGSVADTGTVVPGTPPPQPPTVPSGTVLEVLNNVGCPTSGSTVGYGGFFQAPATTSGFIRYVNVSTYLPPGYIYVMVASIVGTTFTKKSGGSLIVNSGTPAPNCHKCILPTPLSVNVGDYIGIFRGEGGAYNNGYTARSTTFSTPPFLSFTGNPVTATTGTVTLTNSRLYATATIEA